MLARTCLGLCYLVTMLERHRDTDGCLPRPFGLHELRLWDEGVAVTDLSEVIRTTAITAAAVANAAGTAHRLVYRVSTSHTTTAGAIARGSSASARTGSRHRGNTMPASIAWQRTPESPVQTDRKSVV